jgi:hypothetical protein
MDERIITEFKGERDPTMRDPAPLIFRPEPESFLAPFRRDGVFLAVPAGRFEEDARCSKTGAQNPWVLPIEGG